VVDSAGHAVFRQVPHHGILASGDYSASLTSTTARPVYPPHGVTAHPGNVVVARKGADYPGSVGTSSSHRIYTGQHDDRNEKFGLVGTPAIFEGVFDRNIGSEVENTTWRDVRPPSRGRIHSHHWLQAGG
jgi:hypothetical protein